MPEFLRNIGIIAHVDAGKTTLSERILFDCQAISVMGEVANGTAVMDFLPEEQKRGITIDAACISCHWKGHRINLVDTPGHVDFTGEVGRTLRVIDGCLVVVSAVDGVEAQSEMVWEQAHQFMLPRIVFLNKCDRSEADLSSAFNELNSRFGASFALCTWPLFDDGTLVGILDIIAEQEWLFDHSLQGKATCGPISKKNRATYQKLRTSLLEILCEHDDTLLDLWLNEAVTPKAMEQSLASSCRKGQLFPVFCGSALRNIGIQSLLNAIVSFLPDPTANSVRAKNSLKNTKPSSLDPHELLAFVFKVQVLAEETIAWLRIYHGSLTNNDQIIVSRTGKAASITLYRLDAEQLLQIDEAPCGDIVACRGLDVQNGDTCTRSGTPLILEPLPSFSQVLAQRLEPETAADYERLTIALSRFAKEDPTLTATLDENTGAFLVSGMGELHLAILCERILREYGISIRAHAPTVVYRETCTQRACFESSKNEEAQVSLEIAPLTPSAPNSILFATALDQEIMRTIQTSLERLFARGLLHEWPLTGLKVTILSALGTNPRILAKAAEEAFKEAFAKASPTLLWPIMRIEIAVRSEALGQALTLLNPLAKVQDVTERGLRRLILAEAPLKNLLGLSNSLRSATRGRAELSLTFSHYGVVPRDLLGSLST